MPPDSDSTPTLPLPDGTVRPQGRSRSARRPRAASNSEPHEAPIGEWTSGTVAVLIVVLVGFASFGQQSVPREARTAHVVSSGWQADLGRVRAQVAADIADHARRIGLEVPLEVRTNPKTGEIFVRGLNTPAERWFVAARPRAGGWDYHHRRWLQDA